MQKKIFLAGFAAIASLIAVFTLIPFKSFKQTPPTSISEPDTTAPTITRIKAMQINADEATITWLVDEPATSKVYYSTATPVVFSTALVATESASQKCEKDKRKIFKERIHLTGLASDTTYYFIASSMDASNNGSTSEELQFKTKGKLEEIGGVAEPDEAVEDAAEGLVCELIPQQ